MSGVWLATALIGAFDAGLIIGAIWYSLPDKRRPS